MGEKHKKTSKFLSLILRHKPETIGITLDSNGWANINELLAGMKIDRETLNEIVKTDSKGRYKISDDGLQIRANQGHSLKGLNFEFERKKPPFVLYHGTAKKFVPSILEKGLLKQNRHHVHLSGDKETALKVGDRKGAPIILTIFAGRMHEQGFKFYLSENGVWLVDHVPTKYIINQQLPTSDPQYGWHGKSGD